MSKRVVVTGASGFVGSHVFKALRQRPWDVVRSDILRPSDDNDSWTKADLRDAQDLRDLTRDTWAVCHVGGIGDVYAAERHPAETFQVNAYGTVNLLEACKVNRVERLIYASTWEVYGTPIYEPMDEKHPCHPAHPYSISKLAGDLATQGYGTSGEMDTVVLRLATTYGEGMRESAVIPAFITTALRRSPIQIQGTGQQGRQFTHVTDVARAFVLALDATHPAAIYNVASDNIVSIRELADLVCERVPTEVIYGPSRWGEPTPAAISSRKAHEDFGWQAQVTFRQGLDQLIGYHSRAARPIGSQESFKALV